MIYVHIPFCRQKCSYCNFHFSTSLSLKDEILKALKKEIGLRKNELNLANLKSLYFGGGTPSILTPAEIMMLTDEVLKYFHFDPDIEITLEANPDDLNKDFLSGLSKTVVNRLSIGTQSFHDEDLKLMNRIHSGAEAEDSIKRAQDHGFHNISLDLIYGSPVSDFEVWKNNLRKAVALEVPHISSYALTVEPKTALNSWIKTKKVPSPKDEEQQKEFHYMSDFLKDNGFIHYEISNFAKPGFYSRHNTAYWNNEPYLGIGPSAHSYNGRDKRSWNVANNTLYIKSLAENKLPSETEILSEKDRYNEIMMTGLRTASGVNIARLEESFSSEILDHFEKELTKGLQSGVLKTTENHLIIPEENWFLADGIASDLFIL